MSINGPAPAYIYNLDVHQLIQSETWDFLPLKVHLMKLELHVKSIACSQARETEQSTLCSWSCLCMGNFVTTFLKDISDTQLPGGFANLKIISGPLNFWISAFLDPPAAPCFQCTHRCTSISHCIHLNELDFNMNRGKYYKTKQDYVTRIKSDYISAPQVDGRMEGGTVLIKEDDV